MSLSLSTNPNQHYSSMIGVCTEALLFLCPVWIAFLFGLMIGWSWKPKWVTSNREKLSCCVSKFLDSSLPSSPLKNFASSSKFNSLASLVDSCSPPPAIKEQSSIASLVTEVDLVYLYQLVEKKDGGPSWIQMMDRSSPRMHYRAWKRESKTGLPQYCSRTVFEDASPELVRDFFWDDEFRSEWDDMLACYVIIEDCPSTGTMVVQWIRKFPFFCSNREYIIGRRIWESSRVYYCVTKGVPYPSIPRHDKARRVDLYYSSWCIRAVQSRTGNGQMTACEVTFFHYEDMGIPWQIAKLGVRQGMWATVKKIEPGLRAFQKSRASGAGISRSGLMAQINTEINPKLLPSLGGDDDMSETEAATACDEAASRNIPKVLIFGGAMIILACSIHRGLLTKAFVFGMGRRFGNARKRL